MKKFIAALSVFMAATLLFGVVAFAETPYSDAELLTADSEWDNVAAANGVMSLNPGKSERDINFVWMSDKGERSELKISQSANMDNAKSLAVTSSNTLYGFCKNNAGAEGLEPGTWYYSFTVKGEWSTPAAFEIDADDEFSAIFVSDSQIGRSGESTEREVLVRDYCGWKKSINTAFAENPDAELLLSAGDQVEDAGTVSQYRAFAAPMALRNIRVAATIGNHEFYMPLYSVFNNNPASGTFELLASPAGKGWFFSYGNAVFVVINSNNIYPCDAQRLIEKALDTYPDAEWKVAMLHHSCYSSQLTDDDFSLPRTLFAPLFEKYSFDLVLSGHDHVWSRAEVNGVNYVQAGSGSGSKNSSPADPLPSYTDAALNPKLPIYSVIDFTDEKLTVNTYVIGIDGVADSFEILPEEDRPIQNDSFFSRIFAFFKEIFSFTK